MRRGCIVAAAVAVWAGAAGAGAFDGVYRQGAGADCTKVGQDGGALKIADSTFFGVESQCDMVRPVNVRDMDAVLFDMECNGEDVGWTARALLMHAADDGLIMVWNGYAFKYDRCSEADILEGAVTATTEE